MRNVLGDPTYESFARKGETMTTAEMATYAYDQIDQARAPGNRQSGYLVGVDTPTAQEAALLQKLAEEFGDAPATTHTEDIVRQRREQQAD